ncbi:tail fiber domain-containing protein [Dyadobacter sp. MSC1_007]|jgi:hypothetical protein|uniref:tail fiber domain-containing protein n=1 Tax=Dyadobacter sp. MSC1_007 TaxID=2909264 RepID=UPI00202DEC7E|nr:tail fiber domain-containing protein [Dyadobacter sp. MSC1_007]
MKKLCIPRVFRSWVVIPSIIVAFTLLGTIHVSAQAPKMFNFQGVARDATGKVVVNTAVELSFDIHEGSQNGNMVFTQSIQATTNSAGIFNVEFGDPTLGSLAWESSSYFLRAILVIPTLGIITDLGATPLLSVPYSLSSLKSNIALSAVKSDTALLAKKWIDDEPIIQTGTSQSTILPDVGVGGKLVWYPRKSAFRIGYNNNGSWLDQNIGNYSFASGDGTFAAGISSTAIGKATKASGPYSFAAGLNSEASGQASFAIGESSLASSLNSISLGISAKAIAQNSTAIGNTANASGLSSIALGHNSTAIGGSAIAFGNGAEATGDYSTAFGNSVASGVRSFSVGEGALAKATNGIALGTYNSSSDFPNGSATDRIFQIGNGSSASRSNAMTILKNGNIGIGNTALDPEFVMDFGGRTRVRYNGATAGIYFNNSQNDPEGFVGMVHDNAIGFYRGNAWRLVVGSDGIVSANTFFSTSDKRLKTNIQPLDSSLPNIARLRGYTYNWKDPKNSAKLQTGLIAQEVEAYFPELVNTDKEGYKAVNYIGLIPHLIEAVKELDQKTSEIAELKKELTEVKQLNKRMTEMEASLKTLLTGNTSAIGKPHTK